MRDVVEQMTDALAGARGITVEEARLLVLAARLKKTVTSRGDTGTGH